MPKAKPAAPRATHKDQTLLILSNGVKRVLIPRPKTHKAAIDAARRHFPAIKAEDMVLQTKELEICEGELVDIAPESWELMVDSMTSISVVERHECPQENKPVVPRTSTVAPPAPRPSPDTLVLNCNIGDEANLTVHLKYSTKLAAMFLFLAHKYGLTMDDYNATYDGGRISGEDTPQSLAMEDGDTIHFYKIDATVALTLTREWSFSVIYPVVPTKILPSNGGQRIEWNVRTHLDGNLTETNTGLDVAYLFWEAHTNHGIPPSPPASPVLENFDTTDCFSPLTSDLSPAGSVLIAVDSITPYLDKVLLALGLHTEARTSFITYWLPSFLKHKYVALRFVPQAAYEASAALDISPAPDVVTRVFMLFKGVTDDALNGWSEADAVNDGERWRQVVGVDVARAADATLFRVLEWGGMEVLKR
ncbi:hypothetical protein C8R46DRAFT_1188738 [Mycena filopes]|nr:hypothetical protein C8R46DRAFT_1188738 [Mycena filopes]